MKTLGLDIGTTTISAVVYDTELGILEAVSVKNDSFLPGAHWERIQSPQIIEETACALLQSLLKKHPDAGALGVTGQMHGIVYLDNDGDPVSPLYTWQDGRGDLSFDPQHSWAQHLSKKTGYSLSTGYGMVTHFYNQHNGLIPENAVTLCTIQDYLAMKLSGSARPRMDATNAASLGLFDVEHGCFDEAALVRAGIDPLMLPDLISDPCLGTGALGIPVYAAIGDNQASFLGAANGQKDILLINMGTGGQVSVYSPSYLQTDTLETRPFPGEGWLLVGASLCGGRSYALLERFFRETVKMVIGQNLDAYSAMTRLLEETPCPEDIPVAITTFQGTRKNPEQRGAFSQLSADNFTPVHIMYSVMRGMAEELFDLYRGYLKKGGSSPAVMIGSGNGLRRNHHLCSVFEEIFGCRMVLSENDEEAACGAAIYAGKHAENS